MQKIILIEDDPDQHAKMVRFLTEKGFEVIPCHYWYHAYNAIKKYKEDPHLAAIMSDFDLGTHDHNGGTIYTLARKTISRPIPFIGTSLEMRKWHEATHEISDQKLYLTEKEWDHWNTDNIERVLNHCGIL